MCARRICSRTPVDFVVFDGLCNDAVQRVLLVEVKSGAPRLNARQEQLRSAIASRALPLEWLTVRMPRHAESGGRAPRTKITKLPRDPR